MKLRIIAALVALCALACDASAGPIRDRLRARFGGSCATGSCQSAPQATYAPQPQAVYPAGYMPSYAPPYLPTYYTPQTGCVGGSCPLPQRFVFPVK